MGNECTGILPREAQACLMQNFGSHLVSNKMNNQGKSKAMEAIKKDDKFLLKNLLTTVPPTENLGYPGTNLTCIHFAAVCNSYNAMETLLNNVKSTNPGNYKEIVNLPDCYKRSPAMVCPYTNAAECLYLLLSRGDIDLELKDAEGQSIEQICTKFSPTCLVVLESFRNPDKIATMKIGTGDKEEAAIDVLNHIKKKFNSTPTTKPTDKKQNKPQNKFPNIDDPRAENMDTSSMTYQILYQLIKDNKNFEDMDFPHNVNSISTNKMHESYDLFSKCTWERPTSIFGCNYDQIHLFDHIEPGDIKQGCLGVCYFLSAISALAEYPSRLMEMYVNQNANRNGVYGMKFLVQGIPTEIVVDDYFPCMKSGDANVPIFSRPNGRELWVLIAEKAWGKLFGNYTVCEAGFMDEAFEYLLGEPAFRYYMEDQTQELNWDLLYEADQRGWIMCAATKSNEDKNSGLVSGHAYTVVSLHKVDELKLLKIRNPWGKFEWTGDYSDKSDKWTDELKSKVGWSDANDGAFYMQLSDYCKFFDYYSIGMCEEGWHYNYLEGEHYIHRSKYYTIDVKESCEAYFRVHFRDHRFLGENAKKDIAYPFIDFIVARREANGTYTNLVYDPKDLPSLEIGGRRTVYPCKQNKLKLTPGQYIIRVKGWMIGQEKSCSFVLSSYTSEPVELRNCDYMPGFFKLLHYNELKRVPQEAVKSLGNDCYLSTTYSGNTLVIIAENRNKFNKLKVDLKFPKLENLKLGKAYRVALTQIKMEVGPERVETCYLSKIDMGKGTAFSYQSGYQWQPAM